MKIKSITLSNFRCFHNIRMDEIYADEEPALTEAELYIENKSWELSLEKN